MDDERFNLADLLQQAQAGAERLNPDKRDDLAAVGVLLETVAGEAPDELPLLQASVGMVLETLEGVYLSKLSQPAAKLALVQAVLAALSQWATDGFAPEAAGEVRQRAETLRQQLAQAVLQPGTVPATVPAEGISGEQADDHFSSSASPDCPASSVRSADSAGTDKGTDSGQVGDGSSAGSGNSEGSEVLGDSGKVGPAESEAVGLAVHDLAAVLIGLGPDDIAEVKQVRENLEVTARSGNWSGEAIAFARQAVAALKTIESASVDDPEEALGEALEALGQLNEVLAAVSGTEPTGTVASGPGGDDLTCLEFDGDPELLNEFVVESLDHLQMAENSLLELELHPGDKEAIDAVYRGFHTIKGTAGFLGLREIQQLAHQAENLLDQVRKEEIRLAGSTADLALESADMLKEMISDLPDNPPGSPTTSPVELDELLARLAKVEADEAVDESAEGGFELPRLGDILISQGQADRETIEQAVQKQGTRRLGETLVQEGTARSTEVAQALRVQRQVRESNEHNVRVRTDRLDALINMVGELVIANAMVSQDEDVQAVQHRALGRKISQLAKITRELQGLTMAMRMVPLRATFQKMARAVRDVARQAGKEVKLITEGEDTEIDRNMVESLSDPLLHMVRNAVDHGLESPAVRAERGKSPTGTLQLRAYHEAGNVVIEMTDDGQGLDRERILSKAVANGVVSEDKELSDDEVYRLIFSAGLSTAQQVTSVSGRGVGMDVLLSLIHI